MENGASSAGWSKKRSLRLRFTPGKVMQEEIDGKTLSQIFPKGELPPVSWVRKSDNEFYPYPYPQIDEKDVREVMLGHEKSCLRMPLSSYKKYNKELHEYLDSLDESGVARATAVFSQLVMGNLGEKGKIYKTRIIPKHYMMEGPQKMLLETDTFLQHPPRGYGHRNSIGHIDVVWNTGRNGQIIPALLRIPEGVRDESIHFYEDRGRVGLKWEFAYSHLVEPMTQSVPANVRPFTVKLSENAKMVLGDGQECESGSEEFSREVENFRKKKDGTNIPDALASTVSSEHPSSEVREVYYSQKDCPILPSGEGSEITIELSYTHTRSGGGTDGGYFAYPIEALTENSLDVLKNAQKDTSISIGGSNGKVDIREARTPSPSRSESPQGRGA